MSIFDRFLFQFCVGIFFGVTLWRADILGCILLMLGIIVGAYFAK
jgi:hypothetical protein